MEMGREVLAGSGSLARGGWCCPLTCGPCSKIILIYMLKAYFTLMECCPSVSIGCLSLATVSLDQPLCSSPSRIRKRARLLSSSSGLFSCLQNPPNRPLKLAEKLAPSEPLQNVRQGCLEAEWSCAVPQSVEKGHCKPGSGRLRNSGPASSGQATCSRKFASRAGSWLGFGRQ